MADSPLCVLHVVDCLNVGGTERQLFELLRRLDRTRFRPLLACFKAGGELFPRLMALGITPHHFPLRGSLMQPNTLWQAARMAHFCRREGVKVIHAHDFYSNLVGVAAAALAGTRVIASRRDLAHWLSPAQRQALRLSCRLADTVVANAEAVAAQSERELGTARNKLYVVPNGIDVETFDRQAAAEPDPPLPPLPPGAWRVVMVGSMHLPDKGHADLLHAAAQLRRRGVHAQYLLVSDGALRPSLEAKARELGLADVVHFLGRRADVPSVLARADVVAHPSWAEGFPNAVLEGMCAARPVVATRIGGIPEVMTDGAHGLLVSAHRPDELARALERLRRQPEWARALGQRARARVEQSYRLDRMRQRVEALYERLAAAPPLHRPLAGLTLQP